MLSTAIAGAQTDFRNQKWDPGTSVELTGRQNTHNIPSNAPRKIAQVTYRHLGNKILQDDSASYDYTSPETSAVSSKTGQYAMDIFKGKYRYTYTYDHSGYLVNQDIQTWDTVSASFRNTGRKTFLNNANGQPILIRTETRDKLSGAYDNSQESSNIYNKDGFIIDSKDRLRYENSTGWDRGRHTVYTRNNRNRIVSCTITDWNSKEPGTSSPVRTDYSYDAAGTRLLGSLTNKWEAATSTWTQDRRTAVMYADTINLPVGLISESYYTILKKWDTSSRTLFYYDAAGNKLCDLVEEYNRNSHRFFPRRKAVWTYNEFNQPTSYIVELEWKDGKWVKPFYYLEHFDYYEDARKVKVGN
jgi:hypothetical protein